jgi:ankyrin repeat protein
MQQLLKYDRLALQSGDQDDKTALHWAAENGHTDIVKLFIDKGILPSSEDTLGRTALHLVAEYGHEDVCRVLGGLRRVKIRYLCSGIFALRSGGSRSGRPGHVEGGVSLVPGRANRETGEKEVDPWWLATDPFASQMVSIFTTIDPFCGVYVVKIGDKTKSIQVLLRRSDCYSPTVYIFPLTRSRGYIVLLKHGVDIILLPPKIARDNDSLRDVLHMAARSDTFILASCLNEGQRWDRWDDYYRSFIIRVAVYNRVSDSSLRDTCDLAF